jgi:hypothetical protein
MESAAHQQLKWMAIRFLRRQGCAAVATEVSCPIARHRLDAAGYCDRSAAPREPAGLFPPEPAERRVTTTIIECKQDRSDFLRDDEETARLLSMRDHLERLRAAMEATRVRRLEPHLRRSGTSLFADLEVWDFDRSRLPGYRRLLRRLEAVDTRLHGGTKFCRIGQYRLADRLYIATPRGMIRRNELPRGWGLLECSRRDLAACMNGQRIDGLVVAVEAPDLHSRHERQRRLLRNIAVAASRSAFGAIAPFSQPCPGTPVR